MKIKTFKVPCHFDEEGEFVMDEENKQEMTHLEKVVDEQDLLKLSAQIGNYNQQQMKETKAILGATGEGVKKGKKLKNQGDGEAYVLRQLLVE